MYLCIYKNDSKGWKTNLLSFYCQCPPLCLRLWDAYGAAFTPTLFGLVSKPKKSLVQTFALV